MARILLVDDDPYIRGALGRVIESLGHEVLLAESGIEALKITRSEHLDLIVSDVNMPEMDGIELLMEVREEHPDLPVLIMSGGGMLDKEVLLENAEALGAHETLAKPFEIVEVEATIERLLRGDPPAGTSPSD